MRRSNTAALLTLLLGSARTLAEDVPVPQGEAEGAAVRLAPEWHGFVSPGFLITTDNNYLARRSTRGSFEFAEVGVNLSVALTEELRAGIQLFARDLGPTGNYSIKADWFMLDYRFRDWLGLRAGRTKIPWGLYNEISDVDVTRVPILLPQSVYPIRNRDFLLAQTGVELYGRVPLGLAGTLEYRFYGGTIFLETTSSPTSAFEVDKLHVPYLAGGRLIWELPVEGLRVGASVQVLRLNAELLLRRATELVTVEVPARLWVASVEYQGERIHLAAEYSRWPVEAQSSDPMMFPESKVTSERLYGMFDYRVTDWFHPGVYYSLLYPKMSDRSGHDAKQHDGALTLRFDINSHWIVKLEGHYMRGTAGLDRALNGNQPLVDLTRDWGVALVKTTAYW